MTERLKLKEAYTAYPKLPTNLLALGDLNDTQLDKRLVHLVKIRASQLNRCTYCLDMHCREARNDGENQQRLDLLCAWRESSLFNSKEKAALAFCECLTLLNSHAVDDALYEELIEYFHSQGLMELTSIIIAINGWNRVVATLQAEPDRR